MGEKLFTVELIFRTVIRGTKESVLREAEEIVFDSRECASEIYTKEIKDASDLPEEWSIEHRPWGNPDPYDRTIGDILANKIK